MLSLVEAFRSARSTAEAYKIAQGGLSGQNVDLAKVKVHVQSTPSNFIPFNFMISDI